MHESTEVDDMSPGKRVAFYLRVSTAGQTVENQRQDLQRVADQRGWELVETYIDHGISGAKGRDKRPALERLCKDAARGRFDIVAAWAIDRLGRSLSHLAAMLEELQQLRVGLYLHQQAIDSSTPAGKAMLAMCGVFAEFERAMLVERINAGLARAKSQGKKLGRPTSTTHRTEARVHAMRKKGYGKLKIARELGIGTSTVQRILAPASSKVSKEAPRRRAD
jgi:DNA invertase Pin-like site-specific DNA recombinase